MNNIWIVVFMDKEETYEGLILLDEDGMINAGLNTDIDLRDPDTKAQAKSLLTAKYLEEDAEIESIAEYDPATFASILDIAALPFGHVFKRPLDLATWF